jgi:hypothetical protein
MSTEEQTFSKDYVVELRNENAKWRTKCRELEGQVFNKDIENELIKRGVNAKASWVEIGEDQSVKQAVDSFLEEYPHFLPGELEEKPTRTVTRPMSVQNPNTNTSGPGPRQGPLGRKTLKEIKEDPKSRAALRSQYQAMLRPQEHLNGE